MLLWEQTQSIIKFTWPKSALVIDLPLFTKNSIQVNKMAETTTKKVEI